jgi:S1-C subfamily serine protease
MSFIKATNSTVRQVGTIAGTVLGSVVLTLGTLRLFPQIVAVDQPTAIRTTTESGNLNRSPSEAERSFVALAVEQVGPAVVRIDTERTVAVIPTPFFDNPFFQEFFGRDVFPQLPQEFRQHGQGSGFITDRDGLILTNAHVVSGANEVTVTLRDGRTFTGEVRGIDEPSDLAVVKINGSNLPVAPLGSSAEVQVGDWAIAVGNPLGLDNTVTLGIISTLNRTSSQVGIADKRLDFLQTDAAINPGNSGGPLVNQRGEVIGINTAIRADAQGIGFAIPIDKAKQIKDILARGEKVSHPYIGIRMVTLTPEIARQLNENPNSSVTAPEMDGVLVIQVVPDSPAAKGGIRQGDVITEANNEPITTAEQLQDAVEATKIDQPLRLTIRRGEQTQEITVRPSELQNAAE